MDRKTYRETAFSMIFSFDFQKDELAEEFYVSYLNINDIKDDAYLKKVFFGVVNSIDYLDSIIERNLKNWKISRLSKVTLSIMRLAICEFSSCDDIPFAVSINEAVELSKKFDEESSSKFINGVLNSVAVELNLK